MTLGRSTPILELPAPAEPLRRDVVRLMIELMARRAIADVAIPDGNREPPALCMVVDRGTLAA